MRITVTLPVEIAAEVRRVPQSKRGDLVVRALEIAFTMADTDDVMRFLLKRSLSVQPGGGAPGDEDESLKKEKEEQERENERRKREEKERRREQTQAALNPAQSGSASDHVEETEKEEDLENG